jgi:hypothetical protein
MPRQSHEVLIAILGLVGVLATGVLSNTDKLFGENPIVKAEYTGYKPTGNFETEFRYYFEVSGARATMDSYMKTYLESQKTELLSAHPEQAAVINRYFEAVSQEMPSFFDEVVTAILPVYQKYFTLEEIQALDKFYSTGPMRQMVREGPLIAQEIVPVQNKLVADLLARIQQRIR